ncbi:MAG TPA: response regulator [Thermoanaerobaculia bacterium]|nr:response regulator [Thermoanaerobaculia bacterium]
MPATTPTRRALVVEDDPAISKLVQKLLARRAFEIDVAHDGRTAVERLDNTKYSVIVLDLMVPGVDGFAIIDYVKERDLRVPVAVVSAVSQQALTRLDLDVVKVVISKPFDVDEFTKAIVTLCEDDAS